MRKIIIGIIIVIIEGTAYAADPAVVASKPNPSSIKSSDTFKLSYYLKNSRGSRIMSPSGSVSLYSYSDPSCSNQLQQVGSNLDLSVGTIGTYSISSSGTYYLKPSLSGYVGNCVGPLTVFETTTTSADGTTQPLVFQKLSISKSPGSSGNVNISLSWLNNSDLLVTTATSSNKATFFLSQSQSCSSRISGSRLLSYSPKFGQASFSTSLPNVTPVFGCAYAYSGQTKITAQSIELKSSCVPPQTLINGLCSSCPSGTSLISGKCVTTTKSCEANNGFGTSTVDLATMSWGDCILSSCSAGYHLVPENNTCEANSRECSITDGVGSQTWDPILSSWGSCILSSCDQGFHSEGNECVFNEEDCVKATCYIDNYVWVCNPRTSICSWVNNAIKVNPGTAGARCSYANGSRIWADGSWGDCFAERAPLCRKPSVGVGGFTCDTNGSGSYSTPSDKSCSVNIYVIYNIGFDSNFQKKWSGVATGKQKYNIASGTYGDCVIEDCPEGSHLEKGNCLGDRKNARLEGFLGLDGCYYDSWDHTKKKYKKYKYDSYDSFWPLTTRKGGRYDRWNRELCPEGRSYHTHFPNEVNETYYEVPRSERDNDNNINTSLDPNYNPGYLAKFPWIVDTFLDQPIKGGYGDCILFWCF